MFLYNEDFILDTTEDNKYLYFEKEPFPVGDIFKLLVMVCRFGKIYKEIENVVKDIILYILYDDKELYDIYIYIYIYNEPNKEEYIDLGYLRKYDKESIPSLKDIKDYIFEKFKLRNYILNLYNHLDIEIVECESNMILEREKYSIIDEDLIKIEKIK